MEDNRSYREIPQIRPESTIIIPEKKDSKYIGKAEYICNKTRICGSSNCILITTYCLIIIPTLLYLIVMYKISKFSESQSTLQQVWLFSTSFVPSHSDFVYIAYSTYLQVIQVTFRTEPLQKSNLIRKIQKLL